VETVDHVDDIAHPLAREVLKLHGLKQNLELTSIADLPAKTGMGSSGAYLAGLLAAVRAYLNKPVTAQELAEEACHIEMDILEEPVGKQDQYMAAFGGFRVLNIDTDGVVTVETVPVDFMTANELVSKARIYYTGVQRSATAVLKTQDDAARQKERADHDKVVDALTAIKTLGGRIRDAFAQRDLDAFGRMMDEHWMYKKQMSRSISLSVLDELYDVVKKDFGVLGGKIIGAGGGGFFMLYCPQQGRELDEFMAQHKMYRVDYFPSMQGAKVVSDMTPFDYFGQRQ
jgi:D-glycero-alpha-D-manno-heptose-7-phosphate kinase